MKKGTLFIITCVMSAIAFGQNYHAVGFGAPVVSKSFYKENTRSIQSVAFSYNIEKGFSRGGYIGVEYKAFTPWKEEYVQYNSSGGGLLGLFFAAASGDMSYLGSSNSSTEKYKAKVFSHSLSISSGHLRTLKNPKWRTGCRVSLGMRFWSAEVDQSIYVSGELKENNAFSDQKTTVVAAVLFHADYRINKVLGTFMEAGLSNTPLTIGLNAQF